MGRPKIFTDEERKARARAATIKWLKAHPGKPKEYSNRFRKNNPNASKEWYVANRERKLQANAEWRANNREYATQLNTKVARSWRAKHPDKVAKNLRRYELKWRYGITPEEYDAMFRAQSGRCAICNKESTRRLCVDHCHDTHTVRRLLCHKCNLGIGYFHHDIRLLQAAIDYLKNTAAIQTAVLDETREY